MNIEAAYHRQNETAYGSGDVSLSLKYLEVPYTQTVPAIVFGLQTQFLSEDQHLGLGTGAYELNPFVGLLKTFDTVIVQGNVGWLKQVTHAHESACSYDLSAAVPVYQRKFYLLIETSGQAGRSNQATIAPGVKYLFPKKFSAGIATPIGLTNDTEAWGIFTQFEFQF